MADRITIANAALTALGEEPLEFATPQDADQFRTGAFYDTEDDVQVKVALAYPQVRAKLLNAHAWSWLKHRAELAEAPAGPGDDAQAWIYPYRYHVPEARIGNVRAVWDNRRPHAPARVTGWDTEGFFIFADFRPAWILSLRDAGEEGWPSLFEVAVTTELTARLAMSIKEDVPTMNSYLRLAKEDLSEALRVDSQSHPPQVVEHFEWLEERVGGYDFRYGGGYF